MARFIHLAPEPLAKRIRRSGIAPTPARDWLASSGIDDVDRVVWAFPVTPSFTVSHQWLRELKRTGARTIVAVTFRIADEEPVLAGHYGSPPRRMTAAEAIGVILSQPDPLGYEVMVPRRIQPAEIVGVRTVPQNIGWRVVPGNRKVSVCSCPMCFAPGTVKSALRRRQFDQTLERRSRNSG